MAKRRKTLVAWACVGSNGMPFFCMMAPSKPELVGRFEIFENYNSALRMASGPGYVRRVKIYIDAEPCYPRPASTRSGEP